MERGLGQKLLAEFVGTFTLVFIGAGAIIATTKPNVQGAGLVTTAIAYGLAVATMVAALARVSGAHFNPAITIGAWVTQRIATKDALVYILTQLAGAAAGAALLRAALPQRLWEASSLGAPLVDTSFVSNGQAVLIEAMLTFFLVWVFFATVVDPDGTFSSIAGLAIGSVIVMDVLMGGPWTGAAMNPARAFGPALLGGSWSGWWVYWVGPVAGGIVAATLYDSLIMRPRLGAASVVDDEALNEIDAHDGGE